MRNGCLLFLFCVALAGAKAQTDTAFLNTQRDIPDVFRQITGRKPKSQAKDTSQNTRLSAIPGAGYTLHTKFAVVFAMNVAFYARKDKTTNLSVINLTPVYTQNRQFILSLQSNIWSRLNRFNFQGDSRYYKYPQNSYGLGGHTTLHVTNLVDYSYISVREAFLKAFSRDFFFGLGVNYDYHFNISESGNSDGTESDFHKYGFTGSSVSSGPSLHFLHDDRRNPINPRKGFYTNLVYRYNSTYLNSSSDWQSLLVDLRKYIPFGKHNVLALWSYNWFAFGGKAPYLDLPSTGWDMYSNIGRGYIQSRLRGNSLFYLESEMRFDLLRNGLLGGVVFVNGQSVSNWPGKNFDKIWPGGGVGLRIKLNKHSNTNVAIDYGFGLEGSQGLFVNLGEVF